MPHYQSEQSYYRFNVLESCKILHTKLCFHSELSQAIGKHTLAHHFSFYFLKMTFTCNYLFCKTTALQGIWQSSHWLPLPPCASSPNLQAALLNWGKSQFPTPSQIEKAQISKCFRTYEKFCSFNYQNSFFFKLMIFHGYNFISSCIMRQSLA